MDKSRIIIVVLAIWCVGVTFYAVSPGSGVSAGESAKLQREIAQKDKEIAQKDREIAQLKDFVEKTRPVSSKKARDNMQKALERASQEKKTGREFRPKSQM